MQSYEGCRLGRRLHMYKLCPHSLCTNVQTLPLQMIMPTRDSRKHVRQNSQRRNPCLFVQMLSPLPTAYLPQAMSESGPSHWHSYMSVSQLGCVPPSGSGSLYASSIVFITAWGFEPDLPDQAEARHP